MFKSRIESFQSLRAENNSKYLHNKRDAGILWTLIMRQQNRLRTLENNIKTEFFSNQGFSKNANSNRKYIPRKTWNRYSAFLTCQQQIYNQSVESKQVFDEQIHSNMGKGTAVEGRISIQVKSIKTLPIWATALNELSLIENDISSLSFMDCYDIANIIAVAA